MTGTTLRELLERNADHVHSLPSSYFDKVQQEQKPAAVSICCSDSRVSQEGMWGVTEPGWLFTPSTIGNQVWDDHDGERVVAGSVLYPITYTETSVTLVVGHTGCGAVMAALEAIQTEQTEKTPPGVAKLVDQLVPVVERGLEDDRVDPERSVSLVNQLVEYNVDEQVQFLLDSEDVPDDERIYGFVYDFQGIYGDERGKTYLVNADGETDPEALTELVPAEFTDYVDRLL